MAFTLQLGEKAPGFTLPATDGKSYSLIDFNDSEILVIFFTCNHCPYVKAIRKRLVRDTRELRDLGINSVAVMSNDPTLYIEDSFESMQAVAAKYDFPFPYLQDETQGVAKAYGAICTPDFFGYNSDMQLQYRGRLDASGKEAAAPDARRDLFEAMRLVAETGEGPENQLPGIGCSIKWRDEADQT